MKVSKAILLVAILLVGTSVFAQAVPEGFIKKVKAKQELITKDLQLTPQQAETYYKCEIEKFKLRAEKIKPEMTPEQLVEARKGITAAIRVILLAGEIPAELIPKISAWNVAYDKANAPK